MMKCPRCKKEVWELDEKCKYCGLNFEKYEQETEDKEEYYQEENGYVTGYNVFLIVLGILIFLGGILFAQEEIDMMLLCWTGGIVFLVIINMLKNIVEELRKLNAKIK